MKERKQSCNNVCLYIFLEFSFNKTEYCRNLVASKHMKMFATLLVNDCITQHGIKKIEKKTHKHKTTDLA